VDVGGRESDGKWQEDESKTRVVCFEMVEVTVDMEEALSLGERRVVGMMVILGNMPFLGSRLGFVDLARRAERIAGNLKSVVKM